MIQLITHIDQLPYNVRYVNDQGLPVERFLEFIQKAGHKSAELIDFVSDIIKRYGLNCFNCSRRKSYDNANNMLFRSPSTVARVK